MWNDFDFSALDLSFELENAKIHVLNAKKEVFFESFPRHMHGFYELHYVFGGRGELLCRGERYPLGPGTVWLNGLGVSHEQLTDRDDNMMEYSFSFDLRANKSKNGVLTERLRDMELWIGEDSHRIGAIFKAMEAEITAREKGYYEVLQDLSRLLLIQVIRNFTGDGEQAEKQSGVGGDRRKFLMDEAFIYLYRDMTLSSLAKLLNLSERQTSRNVREYYGMSFTEMRARSRLTAAARLLREDRETAVGEIAEAVGFSSISHFREAFREQYGVTPAEYRRDGTNGESPRG